MNRDVLLHHFWRAATEPIRIRDSEHAVKVGASYLIAAFEVPVGAALHALYGWWMVGFFSAAMLLAMVAVIGWSAWQEARGAWKPESAPPFTGSCPIREHTGDGAYVGRCEHATYGGFCPRHGALEDYPTRDDREVRVEDRRRA